MLPVAIATESHRCPSNDCANCAGSTRAQGISSRLLVASSSSLLQQHPSDKTTATLSRAPSTATSIIITTTKPPTCLPSTSRRSSHSCAAWRRSWSRSSWRTSSLLTLTDSAPRPLATIAEEAAEPSPRLALNKLLSLALQKLLEPPCLAL